MTEAVDAVRRAGRDAVRSWIVVVVLVAALLQINITLPYVGHLGSALVAVLFLYVPVFIAWRRHETLDDYGFHAEPIPRGLAFAAVGYAIIFPLFAAGFFAFYEVACTSTTLAHLVPRHQCNRYGGLAGIHIPHLTASFLEFCAVQLVVVALPEELFFRGFLLHLLEKRFPPARRWFGGGVGLALVLQAAMFAIVHIPKDGDPRALATFFPALMFGWMRSATGSILAPTLVHAGSNILIRVLEMVVLR